MVRWPSRIASNSMGMIMWRLLALDTILIMRSLSLRFRITTIWPLTTICRWKSLWILQRRLFWQVIPLLGMSMSLRPLLLTITSCSICSGWEYQRWEGAEQEILGDSCWCPNTPEDVWGFYHYSSVPHIILIE